MNGDALRGVPVFDGLSDGQLAAVARSLRSRVLPPGTAIFREGESSTSMYVLARGSVETTKRLGVNAQKSDDAGKQKLLIRLSAPQFFGEMGLLTDLARSATITTETECELLELSRADFERLTTEDRELGVVVLRNIAVFLAERLRRTDLDLVKLTIALSLALGNR